jgi:hypothetical protein
MISMRHGSSAFLIALSLLALPVAANAQARRDAAAPVAAPAGAPNVVPQTADVSGFRSAKFGMSENDVKNAIAKDFGLKGDAVRTNTNPSEQTKILTIKAADVLPGGGMAEVSYVFGFKSKTLIQVGVAWSKAVDDKTTPEQLFSNANVLRTHFLAAGYKPDTVATNMPINGGVLMFRGSDAKDRTTMLILQGTFAQGEKDQRVLTPTALVLFYVADAKSPDVYRLPAGSF